MCGRAAFTVGLSPSNRTSGLTSVSLQTTERDAPPGRAAEFMPEPVLPPGWTEGQESLARATGLAVLLVDGPHRPALAVSNNNSICHSFQSSPAHAHLCEPFCGRAFDRAHEAEGAAHYRCHAGLHCVAVPVQAGDKKQRLAAIGGRAFLHTSDYRALVERVRAGDLTELFSAELFRNVIFAAREDLDELAERLRELPKELARRAAVRLPGADKGGAAAANGAEARANGDAGAALQPAAGATFPAAGTRPPARPSDEYLSANLSLHEACRAIVPALSDAYGITSIALLLRDNESFVPYCVTGEFARKPPHLTLRPREIRLLRAAGGGESLTVPAGGGRQQQVELFPLVFGQEVKGALLVGEVELTEEQRRALVEYCREIALPLEVLRLREELDRRTRATTHLQAFTEYVNAAEPEEAYAAILRHSAELLNSERGSLLLFDERANELSVKAAIGPRAEVARETRVRLGDAVSGAVLREGRPLVVRDITNTGHRPAPAERKYKTQSFISYPIIIGGRRVGVLNVTDKAGGGVYDEIDLRLLEMLAPQMALALDRAEWHQKATQFQLLSITDPLTGLLNRRYLEERLSEELERSKRHRFAVSFLMVDIDDFKNYNDRNGHQAGDLALEMTAQTLKSALRATDVAARYGGEEFSILLPQTNQSEALVIADRIRRRVERTQYPHGKTQPLGSVTVSIGVSSFGPDLDTPASVIHAADQALYVAKGRGKNCVYAHAPQPPPATPDAEHEAK